MSYREPTPRTNPDNSEPGPPPDAVDAGERERLGYALAERFAPHVQAAAAAVRQAGDDLEVARGALERARQAAADKPYQSDRLVFLRAALEDEAEALTRKTTPKKVRLAYRYLLDRGGDVAETEVHGYHADVAELQREREDGVEACVAAERRAVERLDMARAMHERVRDAERVTRQGLAEMIERLAQPDGSEP